MLTACNLLFVCTLYSCNLLFANTETISQVMATDPWTTDPGGDSQQAEAAFC